MKKETKALTLRLPPDLWEKLHHISFHSGESKNEFIVNCVEEIIGRIVVSKNHTGRKPKK